MAELKIKADSGGGTVSLKGPATTTSNAAVQLTLPVDDGTANQYLKTDGSGALSWATVSTTPADNSITGAKIAMGSDAAGDLLYYNGTDYARLAKGNNGETLESGTTPIWKKRGRAIGFDAGYNTGGGSVSSSNIGTSWVEMSGASTANYTPKETDSILHVRITPCIHFYGNNKNWDSFVGYFYYKHQTTGNTSWTIVPGTEGNVRNMHMFDESGQDHTRWQSIKVPLEIEYDHSVTAGEWIQFTIYWKGLNTSNANNSYSLAWNQDSNSNGPMRWSITEYSTRT